MSFLLGVGFLVVGLLISIALHEIGHLVPAKKFGVRVPQYMVGFGPTIWSTTRGETEYGLKAIPLGGYIRLVGMFPPDPKGEAAYDPGARRGIWKTLISDARDVSTEEILPGEEHRAFYRLSAPKKLIVMLAGPLMNLLIAIGLFTLLLVGIGTPTATTTVGTVAECVPAVVGQACEDDAAPGPALEAGVQPGDEIMSIGGTEVESWDQILGIVQSLPQTPVEIVVQRDGQLLTLELLPAAAEVRFINSVGEQATRPGTFVGIGTLIQRESESFIEVPRLIMEQSGQMVGVIGRLPALVYDAVVTTVRGEERDVNSVISLIGIGQAAGEVTSSASADAGPIDRLAPLVALLAALNLILFVFNMIPLPPLDGGHAAGAVIEGSRRTWDRLRGRRHAQPYLLDTAKLVPVSYLVFGFLLLSGVTLMIIDVVNPVSW